MPSYLEIALRVAEPRTDARVSTEHATNQSRSFNAGAVAKPRLRPNELAACGSSGCAGCYDVGDGVQIHPPKCGEEYRTGFLRCEPIGRIQ